MGEPHERFDVPVDERTLERDGGYLIWATAPPEPLVLVRHGFHVIDYAQARQRYFAPALNADAKRTTLDNPAQPWLDLLDGHAKLALVGVPLHTLADLRVVHGLVIEPCFRRDRALVLHTDRRLDQVDPATVVDPLYGYPWTLQRLHHIADRYAPALAEYGEVPLTPIEAILADALQKAGRRPVPQFGISRMRVDFAFPDEGLVVECDGRDWHDARRDARRDEVLVRLGWQVLRLTGSDIVRDSDRCAARVVECLDELAADSARLSPATAAATQPVEKRAGWWPRFRVWLRRLFGDGAKTEAIEPPVEELAAPAAADARRLDPEQEKAVLAPDGVVQVMAPAGSGKTTVLVERVRELRARGVPANRILCTTFNRKAVGELKDRLGKAGLAGVDVRNFHGLGRLVCCQEELFRDPAMCRNDGPGAVDLTPRMWWRLAGQAARALGPDGVSLEPATAKDAVSTLKLGPLLTPGEARRAAGSDAGRQTAAELYRLYEEDLARRNGNDFDDFLWLAVRKLREDEQVRRCWQDRWQYVLVDEYQDIEPAQARLVEILAAPEDNLFCVGDEDQTLYAWRRASVQAIIGLDRSYLGLARVALAHNYRCPAEVVRRSRKLIEHNETRFPKRIDPAPSRAGEPDGAVSALRFDDQEAAARTAADLLRDGRRDEVVLLSRVTRHLRDVALACVDAGVKFDCPEKVLKLTGPIGTLHRYAQVFAALPEAPDPDALGRMFSIPNRYLPPRAKAPLAGLLGQGMSFAEAIDRLRPMEPWREGNLGEAAPIFDALAAERDAQRWLQQLRTRGGLDRHYVEQAKLAHSSDTSDLDDLEQLAQAAKGKTVAQLRDHLDQIAAWLRAFYDPKDGVELNTVHGAKGREWNHVLVFAADDDAMPAERALAEAAGKRINTTGSRPSDSAVRTALEDERRIAYVALTRPKQRLIILCCRPSRFLAEADALTPEPVGEPPATNGASAA